MDILYSSSSDEDMSPTPPQSPRVGRKKESPSATSSTALMEEGPSTSATASMSGTQTSPSTSAASTITHSIPDHATLLERHSIPFGKRRLELITEYYNKYGFGPPRSDWTEQRRCEAVLALYLLCTSLMTMVRVVEAVLRYSLGDSRLVEAPRLWTYFMTRMQCIQQRAAQVDPSLFTNNVLHTLPVLEKPVKCRICRQGSPSILFAPCGHMVCPTCSDKLEKCPMCKGEIVNRIKAYF